MTRVQLKEIRACVEGEELIRGVFAGGKNCYCFVGKVIACKYPSIAEHEDWVEGCERLKNELGIHQDELTEMFRFNDHAEEEYTPSPLRAPAVLAYLETLVED